MGPFAFFVLRGEPELNQSQAQTPTVSFCLFFGLFFAAQVAFSNPPINSLFLRAYSPIVIYQDPTLQGLFCGVL